MLVKAVWLHTSVLVSGSLKSAVLALHLGKKQPIMEFYKNKHTAVADFNCPALFYHDVIAKTPQGTSISCQYKIKNTLNEQIYRKIHFTKIITSYKPKTGLFLMQLNQIQTQKYRSLSISQPAKHFWIKNNHADPLTLLNLIRHCYILLPMFLNHIWGLSTVYVYCMCVVAWQRELFVLVIMHVFVNIYTFLFLAVFLHMVFKP